MILSTLCADQILRLDLADKKPWPEDLFIAKRKNHVKLRNWLCNDLLNEGFWSAQNYQSTSSTKSRLSLQIYQNERKEISLEALPIRIKIKMY